MSLYGNFTLKEWLSLHCATEHINELFRRALKDNDEPMAVLALAELIKRGDIDIVANALRDAVDTGCIAPESHFSTVFANALTNLGKSNSILKGIARTIHDKGCWPKTSEELLDLKYLSGPEQIKKAAEFLDGTDFAKINRPLDERIAGFLASFAEKGWVSVEIGHFSPGLKWDSHTHEMVPINTCNCCHLVIKNGFVLNGGEIPDLLSVLDAEGIADPLPKFEGEELEYYTLDGSGNWINVEDIEEEGFFYVSYYPIN